MKKSKLAMVSFVLSLAPIIVTVLILLWTVITSPGTPIQVVEPLEIVDGEIVGGGEIKNTGKTVQLKDITLSGLWGGFGFVFFGFLPLTSLFLVISIILGVAALTKVKKYNLEGSWFAITGIVISVILIIILIAFSIYTKGMSMA